MVTYKLHLIRHGMTEGNRTGRYVGRMDLPICQEGRRMLEQMIQKYRYPQVQEVYCSPLLRCLQTADVIYPGASLTVVDDLAEMSLGEFEGQKIDDLKDSPAFAAWISNSMANTPPGALETGEQFAERVGRALNGIFMNMTQNRITEAAVISHGGLFRAMLASFVMPRTSMGEWALANGGGYTIRMTTELWMRDRIIEVTGSVPAGFSPGRDPRVIKSLGMM